MVKQYLLIHKEQPVCAIVYLDEDAKEIYEKRKDTYLFKLPENKKELEYLIEELDIVKSLYNEEKDEI